MAKSQVHFVKDQSKAALGSPVLPVGLDPAVLPAPFMEALASH